MPQLKSFRRSQLSAQIRSQFITDETGTGIERRFIYLDPILGSRYNASWALNAGDSFTFKYVAPTAIVASKEWLFDSNTAGADRNGLNMTTAGTFATQGTYDFYIDGVKTVEGDTYPTDGKAHELRCEFSNTFTPSRFGTAYNNANYYDGILYNLVVNRGGNTHTFPLDDETATVTQSLEGGLFISIVNVPTTNRELYELNTNLIQWDNISDTQLLPATINLYQRQRHFSKLDTILDSHFNFATPLALNTGDEFEFYMLAPTGTLATREHIFDNDASDAARCMLLMADDGTWSNSGDFDFFVDGVEESGSSLHPTDGKYHHVRVVITADGMRVARLATRHNVRDGYNGIMSDFKATIGGVTTTIPISLSTGTAEASNEGNNTLNYVNIPDTNRELYELSPDESEWVNIEVTPTLPLKIEYV